ncbi:MAG: hypothetical protein ACPGQL_06995 [Thermoplasmatota archaeon]
MRTAQRALAMGLVMIAALLASPLAAGDVVTASAQCHGESGSSKGSVGSEQLVLALGSSSTQAQRIAGAMTIMAEEFANDPTVGKNPCQRAGCDGAEGDSSCKSDYISVTLFGPQYPSIQVCYTDHLIVTILNDAKCPA